MDSISWFVPMHRTHAVVTLQLHPQMGWTFASTLWTLMQFLMC